MTTWECAGRKWGLTSCAAALGWTARPRTQSAAASTGRPGAWTVPSALPRTQVLPSQRSCPSGFKSRPLELLVLAYQISPNSAPRTPESWCRNPQVTSQRPPSLISRSHRALRSGLSASHSWSSEQPMRCPSPHPGLRPPVPGAQVPPSWPTGSLVITHRPPSSSAVDTHIQALRPQHTAQRPQCSAPETLDSPNPQPLGTQPSPKPKAPILDPRTSRSVAQILSQASWPPDPH